MRNRVTIDPVLGGEAHRLAAVAIEMAARNKVTLDYSEASVEVVEGILDEIARAFAAEQLLADKAWVLATVWGSYVGEVFRRTYGGEWGSVRNEGDAEPVVCMAHPPISFEPWVRAMKRITDGADANLWTFYQSVAADARVASGSAGGA